MLLAWPMASRNHLQILPGRPTVGSTTPGTTTAQHIIQLLGLIMLLKHPLDIMQRM